MKKFLITHEATVGRTVEGTQMPPIRLQFYSMVEAANEEAAQDQLIQYKDPGFVSRVASIAEVADVVTSEELFALLDQKKVLVEQGA
jgi:hypothetical protein